MFKCVTVIQTFLEFDIKKGNVLSDKYPKNIHFFSEDTATYLADLCLPDGEYQQTKFFHSMSFYMLSFQFFELSSYYSNLWIVCQCGLGAHITTEDWTYIVLYTKKKPIFKQGIKQDDQIFGIIIKFSRNLYWMLQNHSQSQSLSLSVITLSSD